MSFNFATCVSSTYMSVISLEMELNSRKKNQACTSIHILMHLVGLIL